MLLQGGRQCVGLKLAYAEAKITLIRLYQYYTFRLTPGQVPHPVPIHALLPACADKTTFFTTNQHDPTANGSTARHWNLQGKA